MGCMYSKRLLGSSTSDHEIVEEVDNYGATAQIISQINEQNEAGSGLKLWVDGDVNKTDIINERIYQPGMCTNTIFINNNGGYKAWISQMAEKVDFLRDGQEVSVLPLQNNVYFEVTLNHHGIWYGSYMDRVWFEEIPQSRQEEILIYVYMNWEDLQQDPSVIEALKETRFVSSSDGGLYKPKDLFDPDDVLLTSVFTDEVHKFPGTRFVSDKWLNILRQTGLRNTGDVDILLICAKKVEFLGAESNNLCHILGKIACIPAEKGFPFEIGKKGVKRVLCSYSEAILLKDWPLAWSVAPIISRVPPESSWGDLQLRSPPPFALVLKHLQAKEHTVSSFSRIEEACFEVLKYLDVIWGTISSSETIEQPSIDRSNWESQLFVPDDHCRLVHPNSCVYIDRRGSRYVKYIDSSKLRFVHPDVSERLCLAFGIAKLSSVVVEEIDGVEHLQNLEEIGSVSLASIKQKLLNRSFQVAVSSVLSNVSSSTPGSKIIDFPTLKRSLESVAARLQFVECVYTRFWLLPMSLDITHVSNESSIPEWDSGASHRALYYVDRSPTCMLIAKPPSYISVLDLVVIVVSQVIGSPVPLPIGPLFFSPKGSETALVNILQISSNKRLMDGVGIGTHFLGREILPQDAMNVELDISRPFFKGEIVAWQKQTGEKLKYGRILKNVKPPTGQALHIFHIETSPGKAVTICSSRVFCFKNFSTGYNFLATHVMPEEVEVQPPIEDLERGRVSAEEYSEAVEELLSGAGINLEMEKQCLLKKTLCLQEQLSGSQAALLLEQEKLEVATKEVDTAKAEWQCRICLASEINVTLDPCGHVLCHRCSSAVSRCPFCRRRIFRIIKMYRP
ncbi:zinc finger, C3HC4 type [Artemisia annua]|uniref:Zinc finger, C3HC4 type n=1 Tax=Artemisia annua TaxID=35608 RepID=A0A2U1P8T9_ARTAN|nr:zinc finger, C3HC4 type [Artemisia annua]